MNRNYKIRNITTSLKKRIKGNVLESQALTRLRKIKRAFANYIGRNFEHLALDCSMCKTPCCAEAQFVNVNISKLEAVAMIQTLETSSNYGEAKAQQVLNRAEETVKKYNLREEGDTFSQTYSCPLYEPGQGCLVHWKAKPAPCIQHGCYERWQDLPETGSLRRVEAQIEKLNSQVYQEPVHLMTIPVWLVKIGEERRKEKNS